jgi:hypothetical protein
MGEQAPALTGGATARAHAPEILIGEDTSPARLGRAIAGSVVRGIGK